jgi:osmotically inducible lipoprotein OsmB
MALLTIHTGRSRQALAVLALSGALFTAGCQGTRLEQNTLAGGVIGGGLGALTAAAFGASAGWVIVAGAAGATAGAIYARHATRNECAVSNGNGTYRIVRC